MGLLTVPCPPLPTLMVKLPSTEPARLWKGALSPPREGPPVPTSHPRPLRVPRDCLRQMFPAPWGMLCQWPGEPQSRHLPDLPWAPTCCCCCSWDWQVRLEGAAPWPPILHSRPRNNWHYSGNNNLRRTQKVDLLHPCAPVAVGGLESSRSSCPAFPDPFLP